MLIMIILMIIIIIIIYNATPMPQVLLSAEQSEVAVSDSGAVADPLPLSTMYYYY